jgi:hypothetical protein
VIFCPIESGGEAGLRGKKSVARGENRLHSAGSADKSAGA